MNKNIKQSRKGGGPHRLTFPILFKLSTSEKTRAPQNFNNWLSWSAVEEEK